MLRETEAVRFDRTAGNGRTKPIWIGVETNEAGEMQDVLAKYSGAQLTVEGLTREAITALFAADLDMGTPEPLLVRITEEFIESIKSTSNGDLIASSLKNSLVLAYGSTKLPNGFMVWSADRKVPKNLMQQALEIFTFDCIVQNSDRRKDSPNLLCNGDCFSIIDHELAFFIEQVLFWKPPWIENSLTSFAENHIFFESLKSNTRDLHTEKFFTTLENIKKERVDSYINALPDEWNQGKSAANKIGDYIKQIIENSQAIQTEITRVLA